MKAEELYKGVIEIDDRFIEEAQETKRNGKYYAWKRYAAAAACLCLIAVSAVIVFHGDEQPSAYSAEAYHLSLLQGSSQGQGATEICTLSYSDHSADLEHFVTLEDGTVIPAVFVPVSEDHDRSDDADMTLEEAQSFAYMDLDAAPAELQETIRKAREVIIFSQSWVADGFECYVTSPDGTRETIPSFSELFPGWELPAIDPNELSVTADGLGSSAEYGIFVEVSEIHDDYLTGQTTSALAPFRAGQSVRVYFPTDFDVSSVEKGEIRFVSFYGKDCDGASGTVFAQKISAYQGN